MLRLMSLVAKLPTDKAQITKSTSNSKIQCALRDFLWTRQLTDSRVTSSYIVLINYIQNFTFKMFTSQKNGSTKSCFETKFETTCRGCVHSQTPVWLRSQSRTRTLASGDRVATVDIFELLRVICRTRKSPFSTSGPCTVSKRLVRHLILSGIILWCQS